jgi:PKD repeat protein
VAQLPNVDPAAAFTVDCWGLDCDFDASSSADSDGTIVDYSWDFGDLNVGSGQPVNHVYANGGTFDVTLTVTDNRGGTAVANQEITINPIATSIEFRDAVSVNGGNNSKVNVPVPNTVQQGDLLLMYVTNGNTRTADVPAGWTQLGTRTDSELTTQVFWRFASGLTAGTTVTSDLRNGVNDPAAAPVIASLVAYSGVDAAPVSASASAIETSNQAVTNHTTPGVDVPADGAWVLSYWADRNSAANGNQPTTAWTPPFQQAFRADEFSSGSDSRISSLLTDDGGPVLAGMRNGLTAAADAGATKGTMWTIVLRSL